jgi:hypothetical protein
MRNESDKIKVSRTEELKDIIDRMPYRTGRIVAVIVVILTALLLFFGWLIEYPEKVTGPVSITARQAPVKLVANTSGKLHLLKNNGDSLVENEIISYLDNPASINDILKIEKYLKACDPDSLFFDPVKNVPLSPVTTGELSISYYNFLNSLEKIVQYRSGNPFEKRFRNLSSLLQSQLKLKEYLQIQSEIKRTSLKLATKSVRRDSVLFQKETISEKDLERSSITYYGVLDNNEDIGKEITNIGIQINDTQHKLKMLSIEQAEAEQKLRMDLNAIYNGLSAEIRKWKLTNTFSSPFRGRLEYLNFWRENDFISAGVEVFSVIPADNPILGQIYLPSQGAGKVAVGQ